MAVEVDFFNVIKTNSNLTQWFGSREIKWKQSIKIGINRKMCGARKSMHILIYVDIHMYILHMHKMARVMEFSFFSLTPNFSYIRYKT